MQSLSFAVRLGFFNINGASDPEVAVMKLPLKSGREELFNQAQALTRRKAPWSAMSEYHSDGATPLHFAALAGDVEASTSLCIRFSVRFSGFFPKRSEVVLGHVDAESFERFDELNLINTYEHFVLLVASLQISSIRTTICETSAHLNS